MKKHTNGAGRNFGGRKRSIEGSDGPPPTKKSSLIHLDAGFTWNLQALSKAAEAVSRGGKSPVSALNELGVKVSYSVRDHHGPAHCPHFTVAVTVANMTFEGYGTSKREARASAARSCLSTLLARVGQTLPVRTVDFSSDLAVGDSDFQSFDGTPMQQNTPRETPAYREPPPPPPAVPASIFAPKQPSPTHKSPINELYEKYPTVEFQITHGDGSALDTDRAKLPLNHSMRFKVVCRINEMSFEGYGSSKKQAKLAASRSALASLSWAAPAQRSDRDLPQYLADCVAKMVNEKFNELMKNDPVHLKRKVLAGIVMTVNNDPRHAKIIAVTTGTKCVSGDQMSVYGRAVNDCHAEVAARRCLQRYLYNQLLMYAESNDPRQPIPESDVEPVPDAAGGYRLKTDRQIHLYISTAPCGDGRIFSPHEEQLEPDRHPNRFSRGQLRTKIESGEGTIPVKNSSVIQTWDGVLQGSRLLTMSCSDKLARWGAAGLQGALLAALLQPVYLASLVLGSLLQRDHVHRALCGRFEKHLEALPPPYRLTAPMLARAASMESRTPARAPSFSVCWCATTPTPEIINAVTGKLENEQPSMLCKQAMFARWLHLVKRLPLLPQDPDVNIRPLPDNPDNLLYAEAKEMSTTYQVAKQRIMVAFTKAQLGSWVKKPIEQDQFYCEIRDANTSLLFS